MLDPLSNVLSSCKTYSTVSEVALVALGCKPYVCAISVQRKGSLPVPLHWLFYRLGFKYGRKGAITMPTGPNLNHSHPFSLDAKVFGQCLCAQSCVLLHTIQFTPLYLHALPVSWPWYKAALSSPLC